MSTSPSYEKSRLLLIVARCSVTVNVMNFTRITVRCLLKMLHFTYVHVCMLVVSINDDRPTLAYSTCTVYSSVWVLLNCSRFDYSVHCACTLVGRLCCAFHFPKLHSALRRRVASVCSQGGHNSTAAKREWRGSPGSDRNELPHPQTGTVAVTNVSKKSPACCPQGRGQKD